MNNHLDEIRGRAETCYRRASLFGLLAGIAGGVAITIAPDWRLVALACVLCTVMLIGCLNAFLRGLEAHDESDAAIRRRARFAALRDRRAHGHDEAGV